MLTPETVGSFSQRDSAYFSTLRDERTLDPLGATTHGTLSPYQQSAEEMDITAVHETTRAWLKAHPHPSEEEALALRRDFDKVVGHLVATKRKVADAELDETLSQIRSLTGVSPRANIYDYTFGGAGTEAATYTGEEREVRLVDIFQRSLASAHDGINSLLQARLTINQGEASREIESHLGDALDHVHQMKVPMIETYRAVGPEFVTERLTKHIGAFATSMGRFEGPNPSHSGFLVLDRLIYGSFEPIYADKPFIKELFDHRKSDLPPHLLDLIVELDTLQENAPLSDAVRSIGGRAVELSQALTEEVRKFKVMHKSYADKGVAAQGKVISPDKDVLRPTIDYAREIEAKN